MKTLCITERGKDPCLQIQVDLSAMLDGELDASSVRRVMVHSDVCESCRGFLRGIRSQAQTHRELSDAGLIDERGAAKPASAGARRLRQQLMENRRQLSRILYEMGRGFALMGLSRDFSKVVECEPVPVPDMATRGRNLIDEIERWACTSGASVGGEWVIAKELFDHRHPRTPAENLAKGRRLLKECLDLTPDLHEARIYLGMIHHVGGQRTLARREYGQVLADTDNTHIRAFALVNLGNVCLEDGDLEGAIGLFLQLVESGIIDANPRFSMTYFNLALATGLLGRFDESRRWFQRLHETLPHKRPMVARELGRRQAFVRVLKRHPEVEREFADAFPEWFPVSDLKEAC